MSAAVQVGLPAYVPIRRRVTLPGGTVTMAVATHAIVDAADFDAVTAAGSWSLSGGGYVKNARHGALHRFLLRPPDLLVIDHINGDKLDNRRANLRLCSLAQNTRNRTARWGVSEFIGVTADRKGGGWKAKIAFQDQVHHFGPFKDERTAALVRDEAARRLHGEYASLNLPGEVCSVDLVQYAERRIAGLCTHCGDSGHGYHHCPAKAAARCHACGRPEYDPHTADCPERPERGCTLCGEPGHYAKTCRDSGVPVACESCGLRLSVIAHQGHAKGCPHGGHRCGVCGERGHNARTCVNDPTTGRRL